MTLGNQSKKCHISGHSLTYYRQGNGEVILLVHGITTYSFIWRTIFPELAKDFDVIALDLLGCGDSDKPLDISYAIKDHADRLYEFVQTLGITKFHIIGHDLGGGIAQIFAVQHPELLESMTLLNSVGYDFWPVQPITILRTPIVRQLLMATVDFGTLKLIVKRGIFHQERVTPELMDLFLTPLQSSEGRKAFLHFAKCLNNHNLTDIAQDLHTLPIPVLLIRGDADPYLSRSIVEKLHSEIPNSELLIIDTASHFIQEDEPQQVIAAFISFIQRRCPRV